MDLWDEVLAENPLIAILRGLQPERAIEVADILVEAGFRIIEVPLNSPEPLISIERIARKYSSNVIVGAGTVLTDTSVSDVVDAGGELIVAPNMSPKVGARALQLGVKWCPGVATPSEAFAALDSGSHMLKFFPAEIISPQALAAMRAVLPATARVAVVGGITPNKMTEYLSVGANGFGLGSALFKPSYDMVELRMRAESFVSELDQYRTS
jgi:2-dehydro-3-deoxyphosphogalactonate aldolase